MKGLNVTIEYNNLEGLRPDCCPAFKGDVLEKFGSLAYPPRTTGEEQPCKRTLFDCYGCGEGTIQNKINRPLTESVVFGLMPSNTASPLPLAEDSTTTALIRTYSLINLLTYSLEKTGGAKW